MAFGSGTYIDATDLRAKIQAFLIAQGYTLYGTETYQRGNGLYFKLNISADVVSNEKIEFEAGNTIDGGNNPSTLISYPAYIREIGIGKFWLIDDGITTTIVVNYKGLKYHHVVITEIQYYDVGITDGGLILGSRDYNDTDESLDRIGGLTCRAYSSNLSFGVGGAFINGVEHIQRVGYDYATPFSLGSQCIVFGLGGYGSTSYQRTNPYYEGVISASREDNGLPVLFPVWCNEYDGVNADRVNIVGEVSGIRFTNIKGYEPGTVVAYGAENWALFPFFDTTLEDYGFAVKI